MRTTDKRIVIEGVGRSKGVFRAADLAGTGVAPSYLRYLAQKGHIERVGRGLFVLPGQRMTEHHGLVEVATHFPRGVICLLSALQFHGIGTQMPHIIWVAVPASRHAPKIPTGPVQVVHMSSVSFAAGVEMHTLEGVSVRIFSLAKTIADCFKYRSLVGMDVALEALREAIAHNKVMPADLYEYAVIDRVWGVMEPYLEAIQ